MTKDIVVDALPPLQALHVVEDHLVTKDIVVDALPPLQALHVVEDHAAPAAEGRCCTGGHTPIPLIALIVIFVP